MNIRITLIAAACALALTACGGNEAPDAQDTAAAEATATTEPTVPQPAPAAEAPATAAQVTADAAPGSDKPAAVVTDCSTVVEGTDAMQYNVGSITVPASCSEFTITLEHTGKMPVAAMGHNVVISLSSDMQDVVADGLGAGLEADYVESGDARVIAHTELIGGGESTSVTFPVSKIQGEGPYAFFCSFPGHSAVMKGIISVE